MMVQRAIESDILAVVRGLDAENKQRVLAFARQLKLGPGMTGEQMVRLAASIDISPDDLDEMERAIEEYCERVDDDFPEVDFGE